MVVKSYIGIADRAAGEGRWSITFPDFPGVTSVAERAADIMPQAKDALASAAEDMHAEGEPLPPSIEEGHSPEYDRRQFHDPHVLLVPFTAPGRAVRVNISLDEGLHARLKATAERTGTSTSALLARGARLVIAQEQ
ncbi:MAG TPA: plasmid partition protein ParG [Acetobacteraceae bacterium]